LTNDQRIQIRNLDKVVTVKYDRTFPNFVQEVINDCDYTDADQIFLTTADFIFNTAYLLQNNEKTIESSTQLSSVTIFTTEATLVVYSGLDSRSGSQATFFVYQPINDVLNITTV
jgi:hypothetical protein